MEIKKFTLKVKDYIKWTSNHAIAVYPKFDKTLEYYSVDSMADNLVMICVDGVRLINSKHEEKYLNEQKHLFKEVRCLGHGDLNKSKVPEQPILKVV